MRYLADRVRALLALTGPLGAGFRILLLRLVARFGWKTVLIGIGVLLYAANRYRTWIPYGLALACAAAWMHVPNEAKAQAGERAAETIEEGPEETPVDPLPGLLWKLIGEAPGVHVKTLTEHLNTAAPQAGFDRPAVRAALAARGIPIRPSVRDVAGRVNEGVHRDDLEAWEKALSPAAPKALPEARSKPVATAVTCGNAEVPTGVATSATPPDKH
jgi:hypothetical protein